MATEKINHRARLVLGRDIEPGELESSMIHWPADQRVEVIEHIDSELDRPGISMRERARLLDLKMRMNGIHQRMMRVYR